MSSNYISIICLFIFPTKGSNRFEQNIVSWNRGEPELNYQSKMARGKGKTTKIPKKQKKLGETKSLRKLGKRKAASETRSNPASLPGSAKTRKTIKSGSITSEVGPKTFVKEGRRYFAKAANNNAVPMEHEQSQLPRESTLKGKSRAGDSQTKPILLMVVVIVILQTCKMNN